MHPCRYIAMIRSVLCDLLGIEYPVLQGGMAWVADGALAAAVSEAGGLGISEINTHGITGFSIRRVAEACGVSCAAPYKHFKDKREFVASVIDYVNDQWRQRQLEVLEAAGDDFRQQIVAVSVNYIRFLMDKPYYRAILTLKDDEFDNIYHRRRGQLSSRSQKLEEEFFATTDWDKAKQRRKLFVVRSMIFGAIVMFDNDELKYNDETMEMIRCNINREFDLP